MGEFGTFPFSNLKLTYNLHVILFCHVTFLHVDKAGPTWALLSPHPLVATTFSLFSMSFLFLADFLAPKFLFFAIFLLQNYVFFFFSFFKSSNFKEYMCFILYIFTEFLTLRVIKHSTRQLLCQL